MITKFTNSSYRYLWPVTILFFFVIGLNFDKNLAIASIIILIGMFVYQRKSGRCSTCEYFLDGFSSSYVQKALPPYLPWLIISTAFLFIIFRDISLLSHPRFWAEDGKDFFEYAYGHDWIDTFLYRPEYRLFLSNISAFIATRFLSLEHAPLAFSVIWLATILSALAIVLWGNSTVWDSPIKKIVVCAIIIFAPRSGEIWLNANGTQYYTSLITALILSETMQNSGKFKKYAFRFLLILGSLNGVLSCLLTPVFWLKVIKNRGDKEVLIQALILSTGAVIQLISILHAEYNAPRELLTSIYSFGWIAGVKAMGLTFSTEFSEFLWLFRRLVPPDDQTEHVQYVGYFLAAVWFSLIVLLLVLQKNNPSVYLLICYFLLFIFSSIFGIGGEDNIQLTETNTGNRYFYVPSALILIVTMSLISRSTIVNYSSTWSILASLILCLGLINSIEQFYKEPLKHSSWPEWKKEVAIWENDHNHILNIWPSGWTINLNRFK